MSALDYKPTILKILNVFENDSGSPNTEYDKLYLYGDGPGNIRQVTLARGYTECGGALWKVFEYYAASGGKNGEKLLSYKKDSCKGLLARNKEFLNLIISSAREEESMRKAQDDVFDDLYWNPMYKQFTEWGFKEPLSLAVFADSKLHSGGMLKFLMNSFPEKKPAFGGNEEVWIRQYVDARHRWLANHSNRILRGTIYRTSFFKEELNEDNWDLSGKLAPNGVVIQK